MLGLGFGLGLGAPHPIYSSGKAAIVNGDQYGIATEGVRLLNQDYNPNPNPSYNHNPKLWYRNWSVKSQEVPPP